MFNTVVEEKEFLKEAVKILKSSGCPIFGLNKKKDI